ncbi:unnamed protein product [Cuscuta europaea]|uniref:Uncharacterized protein n=1 Tax=Cuscuta europaea TaxID=41803 RepID=A0A9P1ED93_CUSEU|nr:unnamed protein product [Cuscuta europaea]
MPESEFEMEKENLSILVPHGLNYDDGMNIALEKELELTRANLMASEQEVAKLKANLSEVISENAHRLKTQASQQRLELSNSSSTISFLEKELDMTKQELERSEEENYMLKAQLDSVKSHVWELERSEEENYKLKAQLDSVQSHALELEEKYSSNIRKVYSENEKLQSDISGLFEKLTLMQVKKEELEMGNKALEEELILCKVEDVCLQADRKCLENELDALKLNLDMLMTERCEINTTLSSRNGQIQELQSKCSDLNAVIDELRLRVKELEGEIDRQVGVISDREEEKRGVIRQLCFSLEHYRNGYQELLHELSVEKKRGNDHCSFMCFP